jgi:hypothetical protein
VRQVTRWPRISIIIVSARLRRIVLDDQHARAPADGRDGSSSWSRRSIPSNCSAARGSVVNSDPVRRAPLRAAMSPPGCARVARLSARSRAA